jgi:hypothetical protein
VPGDAAAERVSFVLMRQRQPNCWWHLPSALTRAELRVRFPRTVDGIAGESAMYGVGKVHSRVGYEEGAVQDANLQARPRKVSQNRISVISAFSVHPSPRQSALSIVPISSALSRVLHSAA